MSTVEILERVRERLSSSTNWTQGAVARLADGTSTGSSNPEATCWCLIGVLWAVQHEHGGVRLTETYAVLRDLAGLKTLSLSEWNDSRKRKHAEVLDLIDRALARSREMEEAA